MKVAIVEHTIPIDLPKDVCESKGYIYDDEQKVCIMKVRVDLKKNRAEVLKRRWF